MEKHPALYLEVCNQLIIKHKYFIARKIANEALNKISIHKTIRAKIADVVLPFYQNDQYLNIEAFLSCPDSYHCFRLWKYVDDIKEVKSRFMKIDYSLYQDRIIELENACLSEEKKVLLEFLLGDYQKGYQLCIDDNNFKYHELILLITLMLLKSDDNIYVSDIEMLHEIEKKLDFKSYDQIGFIEYFKIWKSKYQYSKLWQEKMIMYLEKKISKKIKDIVECNHRSSYHIVVKYIIALAQVLPNVDVQTYVDMYIERYRGKKVFKQVMLEKMKIYEDKL